MLRQLTPLVRFDGYHVLADITGVPDLYHRIKPTLLGMLPWRWRDPEATVLKPWARAVVTLLGAGRGADARVLDVHDGGHAAADPGHRLGQPRRAVDAARPTPGRDGDVLEVAARG